MNSSSKKKQVLTAPPHPKTMSMMGFVDDFKRIHETMPNRRFAFILGAGASKSSGIKLAGEMVADWVAILHRRSPMGVAAASSEWACAESLGIPSYDAKDAAACYSELYRRMYGDDPDQGYAYLESQMSNAEPSYGYSVLSRLLATQRHRLVITVNFDNLVADSLSIFSSTYPLVCGHESLVGFARADLRRPLVVKVHRDLLLNPMSEPDQLKSVDKGLSGAIADLLRQYTPVVVGYGGNDDSLMACLESIPGGGIPGGIYWCYREAGPAPPLRIQQLVEAQKGHLVPILGFDELMVLLGGELGLSRPEDIVSERAQTRSARLVEQGNELSARLAQIASKPSPPDPGASREILTPAIAERGVPREVGDKNAAEIGAVLESLQRAMGKKSEAKPWWVWQREAASEDDLDKREEIYRAAVRALPNSAEMLGNYAQFLTRDRKDHDAAEAYYKRSLDVDGDQIATLANYANFLVDVRKSYDAAEELYRRAIKTSPRHATTLGNYANFLVEVRKDFDAAEKMYKRSLAIDPDESSTLGNYAVFLSNIRDNEVDAENYFKRSIESDPMNAISIGNYAVFLNDVKRDFEGAEKLYKRAIEISPAESSVLGNYANFMTEVRKDQDEAERLYKLAMEAETENSNNVGNYANFLSVVRKNYDASERLFKRALEIEGGRASVLGAYASFLSRVRQSKSAAEEFYLRAISSDPSNANNIGNYAGHLLGEGRIEDGIKFLKMAFEKIDKRSPAGLALECWMYAYCCGDPLNRAEALSNLKQLALDKGIRTEDWDFSPIIATAKKMKHPEQSWLSDLAAVLTGRSSPSALDDWPMWVMA